ncbi:MAG: tRNA 2-thiouridine(34) synthase MnmA [Muribaculaceae bacterium]|nr:tRNA 2-thiouridine(34) synthase MnmA [Muribaculaceae bacterium]
MAKIAVLVSGGVDSAVVVDKLYREGHDLHLFYIRIGMDNGEGDCSAEEDIEICSLIARKYNLPLEIVPLHDEYWEHVMAYTLATVERGLTPHPDMMCNKMIKFGFFEERKGHEYDAVATGHYASIREIGGYRFLATAADPVKDQTDFLAQITRKQLAHLMFPLGDLPKSEVRRLASEAALPNATRKDSQGICFLGKIDYSEFIERKLGVREGPIVEIETGKKIGTHRGYWFYTIGQRKGLGLSGGPWYVVRKNIRDNVVYVSNGYNTAMQYGRRIAVEEMNWITLDPFSSDAPRQFRAEDNSLEISFKTRHTPEFSHGRMIRCKNGGYRVESDSDVQGIAPGQFVTVYTPDCKLCLGSGMISLPTTKRRRRHAVHSAPATDEKASIDAAVHPDTTTI